jgi:multiple sugar transport system substrate-binding protein
MSVQVTRRDSLIIGAAALGSAGQAFAQNANPPDVPIVEVNPPQYKIEKGATLRTIRPAKFVDPDQTWWDINTKKFTQQTGIPVSVNYISWEDLRPQTAVVAHTGGGVDLIFGWAVDPFLYEDKTGPDERPRRLSRQEIRRLVLSREALRY